MSDKVTKIAVLTSGGDAPGMNAALRAVVRTGIYHGLEMFGVIRGYAGLVEDDIIPLASKSVANIIQRGGTILKTARCAEWKTKEGRQKGYENLKKRGINGLVVIGGDGSFRGAKDLSDEFDIPCVGIPGTIDKDIAGTEETIGFDTAVNTAIRAIDKIRDTAEAHDRLFVVEVMGRDAGYIALHSGIATGAENVLIPEEKTDINDLINSMTANEKRQKMVNLVVVAEGDEYGGAEAVANTLRDHMPQMDIRVCILGHIQRGGAPTCADRILASRMGYHAIEALLEGKKNVMTGISAGQITLHPFTSKEKTAGIPKEMLKLLKILSI